MANIRRTTFANYPESIVIDNYKRVAMEMLRLNFPLLRDDELNAFIKTNGYEFEG